MNQTVQVDLLMALIFAALWIFGAIVNWIMLGLLTRMAQELRKIMEAYSKEQQ